MTWFLIALCTINGADHILQEDWSGAMPWLLLAMYLYADRLEIKERLRKKSCKECSSNLSQSR